MNFFFPTVFPVFVTIVNTRMLVGLLIGISALSLMGLGLFIHLYKV